MFANLKTKPKDQNKVLKRLVTIFASAIMILSLGLVNTVKGNSLQAPYYEPVERFGITAPYGFSGYDIESINVRAALDWGADSSFPLPDNLEYIHVVKIGYRYDEECIEKIDLFPDVVTNLPTIVQSNLGEIWIIGNEPDRFCYQDSLSPEEYAERYFEISNIIKSNDATAKLGFGSVVQPTPIRIRYLEETLNFLDLLTENRENSLNLLDIWSIHAFILNEHPDQWGAGIPVGFEDDWADAIQITDYSDTYSIEIFNKRMQDFRIWMNSISERDKPLWITEYGSLFPPIDPPDGPNYVNVSEVDTAAYMITTFDFLLSAKYSSIGYPADNDHLVQRWFWYSLNDHRYSFGGSLFDPDNNKEITLVGEAFRAYTNRLIPKFVFLPLVKK